MARETEEFLSKKQSLFDTSRNIKLNKKQQVFSTFFKGSDTVKNLHETAKYYI